MGFPLQNGWSRPPLTQKFIDPDKSDCPNWPEFVRTNCTWYASSSVSLNDLDPWCWIIGLAGSKPSQKKNKYFDYYIYFSGATMLHVSKIYQLFYVASKISESTSFRRCELLTNDPHTLYLQFDFPNMLNMSRAGNSEKKTGYYRFTMIFLYNKFSEPEQYIVQLT